MKRVKWPLIAIALLASIAIAQRLYYIPLLPDRIGSEDKRDWVSGTAQLWIMGAVFFPLAALWSVWVIRFGPTGFSWFPNRQYWLANSENRARASMIWLNYYLWMFAAVIGFGIGMTQMVVEQHGPGSRYLGITTVAALIVFCFVRYRIVHRRLIHEAELPRAST